MNSSNMDKMVQPYSDFDKTYNYGSKGVNSSEAKTIKHGGLDNAITLRKNRAYLNQRSTQDK